MHTQFKQIADMSPDEQRVIYSCRTIEATMVNIPGMLSRVSDPIAAPRECSYCGGSVALVNNARFYSGLEYGWPLAYACNCGARVGCHPGTTIPLGTLADKQTMAARRAAHAAFDPIWKGKGRQARSKAYEAMAKALGGTAHISHMNVEQCQKVIAICRTGLEIA